MIDMSPDYDLNTSRNYLHLASCKLQREFVVCEISMVKSYEIGTKHVFLVITDPNMTVNTYSEPHRWFAPIYNHDGRMLSSYSEWKRTAGSLNKSLWRLKIGKMGKYGHAVRVKLLQWVSKLCTIVVEHQPRSSIHVATVYIGLTRFGVSVMSLGSRLKTALKSYFFTCMVDMKPATHSEPHGRSTFSVYLCISYMIAHIMASYIVLGHWLYSLGYQKKGKSGTKTKLHNYTSWIESRPQPG